MKKLTNKTNILQTNLKQSTFFTTGFVNENNMKKQMETKECIECNKRNTLVKSEYFIKKCYLLKKSVSLHRFYYHSLIAKNHNKHHYCNALE